MGSTFCGVCGRQLEDFNDPATAKRIPCPKCGSTSRMFDETGHTVNIRVKMGHKLSHQRDNKTIGFEESGPDKTSTADQNEEGRLSYRLTGNSPQGEEDTLSACRILITVLNKAGGNWGQPDKGDGVVDCQAIDHKYAKRKLCITVVHARVEPELWKTLSRDGKIEGNDTIRTLAEHIKSAIDYKANQQTIPYISRRGLVLAIDATRLPAYGFNAVIEEFRLNWGSWTKKLGFESVWIVGPSESLTWRLDT